MSTIGDRARIRAGNMLARDRDIARDHLISKQAGEIAQLQRDVDVLALGFGEAMTRLAVIEKKLGIVDPYAIPICSDAFNDVIVAFRRRIAS